MRTLGLLALTAALLTAAGGCKKPKSPTTAATTEVVTGTAEPVGGNTNYEAGAGAAQNIRNAAVRTITLAEMMNLGLMIESEYTLNNKMPQLNAVMATLRKDVPQVAKSVDDGKIILCWTAEHQGIWAYEVGADTKGGVVVVSGVARRADAEEVKRLLNR